MKLPHILMGALAALGLTAAPAAAAVVSLDFTGIATTNNSTTIGGFYSGGTSGDGNSGPNLGVTFSSNALAINNYNGCCEPDSAFGRRGILFFQSGSEVTLNYAAGFTDGFSFYYSANSAAAINVYDGLNGTGNLLATLNLVQQANTGCPPGSSGFYCNWTAIGVAFAGTARSIDFGGSANFIAYDNITFGSDTPGVPEPATWAMMIGGFGLVGAAMRRRRPTARAFA